MTILMNTAWGDPAYRIGQIQKIFAYRLITKGTVEEMIVEKQQDKKALADSIIQADESLLKSMSRKDLELLFS